jgi:hypothetical protein
MKLKNIELHNKCQCEIRWRMFKGKDKPTAGLFCKFHDVFLDWLSDDIATELINSGISEGPYLIRKKPKRKKPKITRVQKIHRVAKHKHKTKTAIDKHPA